MRYIPRRGQLVCSVAPRALSFIRDVTLQWLSVIQCLQDRKRRCFKSGQRTFSRYTTIQRSRVRFPMWSLDLLVGIIFWSRTVTITRGHPKYVSPAHMLPPQFLKTYSEGVIAHNIAYYRWFIYFFHVPNDSQRKMQHTIWDTLQIKLENLVVGTLQPKT